ncbi:MAG: DUF4402 domain-containing protein [Balneolaceae bacterium]|nr:DUF4402 domain-containing protein [Balneolaceae bacterium]
MVKLKYIFGPLILLVCIASETATGQEIDFGQYGNYSVSVTELNAQDLDFGTLISGTGSQSIELANAKVVEITGVKYLDVIINITADSELLLNGNLACAGDPSCSIPFTLETAYANRGQNNIAQAQFLNVNSNSTSAQFPILRRESGPPAPPPTPPNKEHNPALYEESAYIYLYGDINVGSIDSGDYSGLITITVVYD